MRGAEGVAERAWPYGWRDRFLRPLPNFRVQTLATFQCSTGLRIQAELEVVLRLSTWILDLASPLTRSRTLGFDFCFLGHSFSFCEMGVIIDENTCLRVFMSQLVPI